MLRKLRIAVASLAATFALTQNAMSAEYLFRTYAYGSPVAEYSESNGFYDCSKTIGAPAQCLDKLDFLGEKFNLVLLFSDSRLSAVSLLIPYTQDVYLKTIAALEKTFTPAIISDGKSILDIVDLAGKEKIGTGGPKVIAYENRGIANLDLTYILYAGKHSLKGKKMTASALFAALPQDTREAQVMVTGVFKAPSMIVRFSFPKHETAKSNGMKQTAVESF